MINLRSYVAGATRRIIQARQFSLSSRACQENASEKPSTAATPPKTDARDLKTLHHLSNFEKKILVWTKRYKTIEEIPETVQYETIIYCIDFVLKLMPIFFSLVTKHWNGPAKNFVSKFAIICWWLQFLVVLQ